MSEIEPSCTYDYINKLALGHRCMTVTAHCPDKGAPVSYATLYFCTLGELFYLAIPLMVALRVIRLS